MRRSVDQRLQDILDGTDRIDGYLRGCDLKGFAKDRLLRDAVERNIEIISEASRHVPQMMREAQPTIPWNEIAGVENILRHGYDVVDTEVIWNTIQYDLGPLRAAVEKKTRSDRT